MTNPELHNEKTSVEKTPLVHKELHDLKWQIEAKTQNDINKLSDLAEKKTDLYAYFSSFINRYKFRKIEDKTIDMWKKQSPKPYQQLSQKLEQAVSKIDTFSATPREKILLSLYARVVLQYPKTFVLSDEKQVYESILHAYKEWQEKKSEVSSRSDKQEWENNVESRMDSYVGGPNIDYLHDAGYLAYLRGVEKQFDIPAGLLKQIMKQESGGKLYRPNGSIIGSHAWAKWLFQFIDSTAKGLYEQKKSIIKPTSEEIAYAKQKNIQEWQLVQYCPTVAARCAALYLKDVDVAHDPVSAVARYNAWPGVLGWQKVTPENFLYLPAETESYTLNIMHRRLQSQGKKSDINAYISNDSWNKDSHVVASLPRFFSTIRDMETA